MCSSTKGETHPSVCLCFNPSWVRRHYCNAFRAGFVVVDWPRTHVVMQSAQIVLGEAAGGNLFQQRLPRLPDLLLLFDAP